VELDELPRDCEPEPGPLHSFRRRAYLLEFLEYGFLILGSDADAGIGDRDLDRTVAWCGSDIDLPAFGREFERVRQDRVDEGSRNPESSGVGAGVRCPKEQRLI